MTPRELAESIVELLHYDKAQAKVALTHLIERSIDDLKSFEQRIIDNRNRLKQAHEEVLRPGLKDLEAGLARVYRENGRQDFSHIEAKRAWLEAEENNVSALASALRSECRALLADVQLGKTKLDAYLPIVDRIARTAKRKLTKTIAFDDRVALVELSASCFVNINRAHVDGPLFSKSLNQVYNCVEACVLLDQLGGLDKNADKFSDAVTRELRRLGPLVLDWSTRRLEPDDQPLGFEADIENLDTYINCGSLLQIWGAVESNGKKREDLDRIFLTSAKIIESGGRRFRMELPDRKLVYFNWLALSHFRHAESVLSTEGVSKRQEIFEQLNLANDALSALTNPESEYYAERADGIRFQVRQQNFAMLALEVDPSLAQVRRGIIHGTLEMARGYGDRFRTIGPWQALFKIFTRLDTDTQDGEDILKAFIESEPGEFAKMRAKETLRLIKETSAPDISGDISSKITELLERQNSIYALKSILSWYEQKNFDEIKALCESLRLTNVKDDNYAALFIQLVFADFKLLSLQVPDVDEDLGNLDFFSEHIPDYFRRGFGQAQVFGLEQISLFLLKRGRSKGTKKDFWLAAAILQLGLEHSDDPFWYSRLSECFMELRLYDQASQILAKASLMFPNDSVLALQRSLLLVRQSKPSSAIVLLDEFLNVAGQDLASSDTAIQGLYAFAALNASELTLAHRTYDTLLSNKPNDRRAMHGLGMTLIRGDQEDIVQGIDVLTDCVNSIRSIDDEHDAYVLRDCMINIAQRVINLPTKLELMTDPASAILSRLGGELRTWQLKDLFAAFEVVGGSGRYLNQLMQITKNRNDPSLDRSFVHLSASAIIEQMIRGGNKVRIEELIDFAISRNHLGDLFASSKGTYARCLSRNLSNPMREAAFQKEQATALTEKPPISWEPIIDVVATDGFEHDYYRHAYDALDFLDEIECSKLAPVLNRVIHETARLIESKTNGRKILLSSDVIRLVRADDDLDYPEIVNDNGIFCDPEIISNLVAGKLVSAIKGPNDSMDIVFHGLIDPEEKLEFAFRNMPIETVGENTLMARITSTPNVLM